MSFDWKKELAGMMGAGAAAQPPAPAPTPTAVVEAVPVRDVQDEARQESDLQQQLRAEAEMLTGDPQLIPNHFAAEDTKQVYRPAAVPLLSEEESRIDLPPRTPEQIQLLIAQGETAEQRAARIKNDYARVRRERDGRSR